MSYSTTIIRGFFFNHYPTRFLSLHSQPSLVILRGIQTTPRIDLISTKLYENRYNCIRVSKFSTETNNQGDDRNQLIEKDSKKPKKSLWQKVKHEALHFYNGFKLLGIEIRIAMGICFRILRGNSLTRRERNQLVRTTADIFRLIPFSVFVIVPFMELLLPLYIKFFPFMLPSTFKEQKKVRESGKMPDTRDIIRFSRLFEDNITLESLDEGTLKALCKLLDLTAVGPKDFLLFQLHLRVRQLKAQDQMIKSEGIESIPTFELQSLCRERGMRSVGLTEERLRHQLKQWLILQLDQKVPISLLLLSRVMYVQDTTLPPAKQLQLAISKITDGASSEATLAIDSIDPKTKIEALRQEQILIKKERKEKKIAETKESQDDMDKIKTEADEQLVDKAQVIYSASGIPSEQLDNQKVETKMKSEEYMTKEDLSQISSAVHIIQEKINAGVIDENINEMREDLEEAYERQLKIKGCDSKVDPEILNRIENLSEEIIRPSGNLEEEQIAKSNRALTDRVDKLLTEIDKMMNQLVDKKESVVKSIELKKSELNSASDSTSLEEDEQKLVDIEQVMSALNNITKPDKSSKMARLLAVLDEDKDGKIETDHILSLIETLEKSNMNVSEKELKKIIEMIDTEKELDLIKNQESSENLLKTKQHKKE